jgi:uncharacterized protein YjdB
VLEHVVVEVVPGPAAKILIDPRPAKLMSGQSFRVVASVLSAAGDARRDRVTWSSSAATIARVSNDGTITAVAPGRATITAAVGTVRAHAVIT